MENTLVHFCHDDGSYLDECYWNDMGGGMAHWLKANGYEAGQYLCQVYDLNTNNEPRIVNITLP